MVFTPSTGVKYYRFEVGGFLSTDFDEVVGELPDFRNPGTILRILLLAEAAKLVAVYANGVGGTAALSRLAESGLVFEMALILVVLVLFLLSPWLRRLEDMRGVVSVVVVSTAVAIGVDASLASLATGFQQSDPIRAAVVSITLAGCVLAYFDWRRRRLSRALARSRLAALQARIRPHFLFNSLNTAVAVVRSDPKLAEAVLLDMTDLFRVVLSEPKAMVPLAEEIRVARAYLAIEQARLGQRLSVRWDLADAPDQAEVPVLLLQPLVENAVWHGIEPREKGGQIVVAIAARDGRITIEVRNPVADHSAVKRHGNRLALANIKERLLLHFDAEADLVALEEGGTFVVKIRLPLQLAEGKTASENDSSP